MPPKQPPVDNNFVAPGCELFQSMPMPDNPRPTVPSEDQLKDLGWRYNRLKSDLARCEADCAKLRAFARDVVRNRNETFVGVFIDNLAMCLDATENNQK